MLLMTLCGSLLASVPVPGSTAVDVGVIRWDAWVGDLSGAGLEAEESMGPSEFHWKVPFYGVLVDDYHVRVRATTQTIIDDEIKYADEAGIGYFAYLYYEGALGTARELHFTSPRRDDVEFSLIIQANSWTRVIPGSASDRFVHSGQYCGMRARASWTMSP